MLEFFEVPSPVLGATGDVASGVNYDWFRQDTKPGLLNLNLVIDEEVFLGLMGNAGMVNEEFGLHFEHLLAQCDASPGSMRLPGAGSPSDGDR